MKKFLALFIASLTLILTACSHSPGTPFRNIANESPLKLRIVNVSKKAFSEDSNTVHLPQNPKIKWYSVTSGTDATTYMIYPDDLDQAVARAVRLGVGMKTISTATILPSEVKELDSGKYALKVLEYKPESQHFGTTAMNEFASFEEVVRDLDMPNGVRILNTKDNAAITLLIPPSKLNEFKKNIERQLPVRSSSHTLPIEKPLIIRVVNAGRKHFEEDSSTEYLAKDARIEWYSVHSGSEGSHYMVYPEELDANVSRALRQGVGFKSILQTKILPSDLEEIETGKYVLKVIEYIPQSQHFGTAEMEAASDFFKVVSNSDIPEGVRFLDTTNNAAITVLVPADKLSEFKKVVERPLPIRRIYESLPIKDTNALCERHVRAFF